MHRQRVLQLYKTILRLHRALPTELQELGNQYVRDEFRRHKGIAPEHVAPFMMEWAELLFNFEIVLIGKSKKDKDGSVSVFPIEKLLQGYKEFI